MDAGPFSSLATGDDEDGGEGIREGIRGKGSWSRGCGVAGSGDEADAEGDEVETTSICAADGCPRVASSSPSSPCPDPRAACWRGGGRGAAERARRGGVGRRLLLLLLLLLFLLAERRGEEASWFCEPCWPWSDAGVTSRSRKRDTSGTRSPITAAMASFGARAKDDDARWRERGETRQAESDRPRQLKAQVTC